MEKKELTAERRMEICRETQRIEAIYGLLNPDDELERKLLMAYAAKLDGYISTMSKYANEADRPTN